MDRTLDLEVFLDTVHAETNLLKHRQYHTSETSQLLEDMPMEVSLKHAFSCLLQALFSMKLRN